MVNFFCEAKNKEFAEKAIGYWDQYFKETIVGQIPNLKVCTYVGGTTVETPDVADDFEINVSGAAKKAILLAIVGLVLSVCAVMAYVLYNPSIATKSDFESYGVSVLDTVKEHGHQGIEFAAEAITQKAQQRNCSAVTIISSINSKKIAEKEKCFIEQLKSTETAKDISFSVSNDIVANYSSFTAAKQSDGVVLLERKGKSCHRDFKRTVSLLKQYEIDVLGVVLI